MIPAFREVKWSEAARAWSVFVETPGEWRIGWYMVLPNESTESERAWLHGEQFDGRDGAE